MAKNKNRFRPPPTHTTLRTGAQPGQYEWTVALQALPLPEREFYANTARGVKRPNYVTFIFGQFSPGKSVVQNAVAIDLPYRTLRACQKTFDEAFREALRNVTDALVAMEPYTTGTSSLTQVRALSFHGHIVKLLISEFAGVLDFYEIEPNPGGTPPIVPVIRIKSLPAVVRWFVDVVDQLVNELPTEETTPEEKTPEKAPKE